MIKRIKKTLDRILLASIATITFSSACGDTLEENSDAGRDAGEINSDQIEVGSGFNPCEDLGELYLNSPLSPDWNKRGAPLSEDIILDGGVTIYQGSRVVAIDQQSGLIYFYGPENNAGCITDDVGGVNTERLYREDFVRDRSCQCYPAAIICREDGAWDLLLDEKLPDLIEDCGWRDLDCDGNPINGYEPDVPQDCTREEEMLGYEGAIFSDNGTRIKTACTRGSQYCQEIDPYTQQLEPGSGQYGFGAINESGQWELGYCADFVGPEQEYCDREGLDNDCDGVPDTEENLGPCGSDEGECALGYFTCSENGDMICKDEGLPQNEACNGRDDNCNERVDEDLYRPCLDSCGWGTQACSPLRDGEGGYIPGENWGECSTVPQAELCDGIDNNCDETIDEGCSCVPGTIRECRLYAEMEVVDELGNTLHTACGYGQQSCRIDEETGEFSWEEECQPPLPSLPLTPDTVWLKPEDCNGYDDECTGHIDEILNGTEYIPIPSQTCYEGTEGTEGVGICREGIKECVLGAWSFCEGQVLPADYDVCWDGVDNDCDGTVDNYLRRYEAIDVVAIVDTSGSMIEEHEKIISFLNEFEAILADSDHLFAHVTFGHSDNYLNCTRMNPGCPLLALNLSDYDTFRTNLENTMVAGEVETDTDAAFLSTRPDNYFGISFRENATPYFILFGDEPIYSHLFRSDSGMSDIDAALQAIARNLDACGTGDGLPGCSLSNPAWNSGDRMQLAVYVYRDSMELWRNATPEVYDIASITEGNFNGPSIWAELVCTEEPDE